MNRRVTLVRAPLNGLRSAEWYVDVDDACAGLAVLPESAGADGLVCEVVYDSGPPDRPPAFLLLVSFAVPGEALSTFDDWYDTEHSPLLLNAPSWLRIRRLLVSGAAPGGRNCFVLHDLADLDVLDGPDRRAAQGGPKRAIIAAQPWYATSQRRTYVPQGAR